MFNQITKKLKSGLIYILCGNFLSKAVALISSVVIPKILDKNEYAYLSYADNLYSYLTLFSGLGLASAILIYCIDSVPIEKHKSYLAYSLKKGGLFEGIAALGLCIAVQFINIPYLKARKYMWLLVLYPVITYLFGCCQSYIRVLKNNKLYAALGAVQTVFICVLSVVTALFFDVPGVVAARYIAVIFVTVVAAKYVGKIMKPLKPQKLTGYEKKSYISMAVALMAANVFSGMMPINEAFLVNNMIKVEEVTANFKVAGLLPSMLPIITSSVMVYYFPIIASLKDYKVVKKKVHNIALVNAVIIILAVAAGMIFTPITIKIIYGEKYIDAIPISYILWIMRAVNTTIRMVPLNVLAAIGKSKFNAYVSAVTCIAHFILDYIFIKFLGINGVAYAAIIVYILSAIVLWWYFNRSCDIMSKQQENNT